MRRQVLASLLAGFAGAALFQALGAGDGTPGVITGKEFKLVDARGRKRASLAVGTDPQDGIEAAGLSLYDAKGARRAAFCLVGADQGSLFLCDAEGHKRVRILDARDRAEISMSHGDGKGYVRLSLADRGPRAILTMRDADGQYLAHTRSQ